MKWEFPSANNTGSHGLKSYQEQFKDNPMYSLAKEVCQNSLDAVNDETKPVIVEFNLCYMYSDDFPDKKGFLDVLDKCLKYNKDTYKRTESADFYRNAIRLFKGTDIPVLKISDKNTKGLQGSDNDDNSDWYNLVKAEGVSDKGDGKGGSFGHGKFATYACSGLQTIFYSTNAIDNKRAYQGVSRLSTFRNENNDKTLGIGYYGNENCNNVPGMFKLKGDMKPRQSGEYGTDIYIMGFNEYIDDWESKIVAAVIDTFFVAIHDNKLVFKIEDIEVNSETLQKYINDELISSYMDEDTKYSYEALAGNTNCVTFKGSIINPDDIELRIVIKNEPVPNHIAMVRMNGMKIYDRDRLPKSPYYGGVLLIKDIDTDAYFRSLENPQHNNWSADRAKDKVDEAKARITAIGRFIKDRLSEYMKDNQPSSIEISGLEEFLPDDIEEKQMEGKGKSSFEEEIKEKNARKKVDLKRTEKSVNRANTSEEEIVRVFKEQDNEEINPLVKPKDEDPIIKPNPLNSNPESKNFESLTKIVKATYSKVIYTGDTYTLAFNTTEKYSNLKIDLQISGETITSDDIKVVDAKVESSIFNRKKVIVNKNQLVVTKINPDETIKVTFKLESEEFWPIEVKYYAAK